MLNCLRIRNQGKIMKTVATITLLLFFTRPLISAEPYRGSVADFVGINTNVGAYDDKIVERLSHVATWMREYHSWVHFEKNENVYGEISLQERKYIRE